VRLDCRLDNGDICLGCCRKKDEIAQWTQIIDKEKLQLVSVLADETAGLGGVENLTREWKTSILMND
jgi:predicted Fe-S protein YdhL (DUF1289 family)